MLSKPPTVDQLRNTFESILTGIIAGTLTHCPTDTGLDHQTVNILNSLGRQPGKKKAIDILACRTEFAYMLDGTHDDEDDAEWLKLLGGGR